MNTVATKRVPRKFVAVGLALALIGGVGLGATATIAAQPHMTAALSDLQSALNQLQAAVPDKAGHRVAAIGLVRQAIEQTTEGLAAGAM